MLCAKPKVHGRAGNQASCTLFVTVIRVQVGDGDCLIQVATVKAMNSPHAQTIQRT